MESRPANQAERTRWNRIVKRSEIINMADRANHHRKDQCDICAGFAALNGFTVPSIQPALTLMEGNSRSRSRLSKMVAEINKGTIGLSFPAGVNGRVDVKGPLSLNSDQIQSYQLDGILIIIGGVMIITGLVLKVKELYERNEQAESNLETCKEYVEIETSKDPDMDRRWDDYKDQHGWDQKQTFVETLEQGIADTLDWLEKPVSTGIMWAIPIVAGVAAIYFATRKK